MRAASIIRHRATHAGRLERWLGTKAVEDMSLAYKDWYGPPVAVAGVPGNVWVTKGGDIRGVIGAGFAVSAMDVFQSRYRKKLRRWAQRQMNQANTGFASLSDLIAEKTAGKGQEIHIYKIGTTGVVGATNTLWYVSGGQPTAGANAGAAPGGTAMTDLTVGAMPFINGPDFGAGDTVHFVLANILATAGNQLLLYDRLFSVTKTMNSTATEAVTGVPTRYQNNTATAQDHAGGNFLIIECRTALPATAHNWTVCTYTDQSGNAAATLPSVTGNSSNIINRLDQPTGTWFNPLAAGDYGVKALTQMQCSALVASGAIDFTIGHPIAHVPCSIGNIIMVTDGINTAFSLTRIFDDACLALLEVVKPAVTATSYIGTITLVAG